MSAQSAQHSQRRIQRIITMFNNDESLLRKLLLRKIRRRKKSILHGDQQAILDKCDALLSSPSKDCIGDEYIPLKAVKQR